MRVLTLFNHYGQYATGGEANVFEAETKLLEEHGHTVKRHVRTNSEALEAGLLGKIQAFSEASWSRREYRAVRQIIRSFKPDIVHVHNFFLMLSPSVFRAAKDEGVPTVFGLPNYRLLSPCSLLMRRGRICEKCVGNNPWRILWYRCYRNSFWASLLRYRVYYLSRKIRKWTDDIDCFIALTRFGADKFVAGGLPADRVYVKPNFVEEPLGSQSRAIPGHGALFVGRLSEEKGLRTLLRAWGKIDYPLAILGDGPLQQQLRRLASENVSFDGMVPVTEVLDRMKRARLLVLPSECYEGFPRVLAESFAVGLPVVASRLGAMAEIVDDGRTGFLFEPSNSEDLQLKARRLIDDPDVAARLGRAARQEYLSKYTSGQNYTHITRIYAAAMSRARERGR